MRELNCKCGVIVKVKNYGLKAKKNKKNIRFEKIYDDTVYSCSLCRGINKPKKNKKCPV